MIVSIDLPALSGSGCASLPARTASHLAEFEVTLDVRQRLDDRGQDRREHGGLDQLRNHGLPPSGSISSGAKYRNRPWLGCISAAGSSSGMSARVTLPSAANTKG